MEEECPNKKNSKACQLLLIILHKSKAKSNDFFKGKKKLAPNCGFSILHTFIKTRHECNNIASKV